MRSTKRSLPLLSQSTALRIAALLLSALAAGCGDGGRDPILGTGGTAQAPPTVTAAAPLNNAIGVPTNNPAISVTFSEKMAPFAAGTSFTVACATPCTNAAGTVALDATGTVANFTLASTTTLAPLTLYTATVTAARSFKTGLALATPFTWQFTTGAVPDTTRPGVLSTVPATSIPGPTGAVPSNTSITAVFTEDMAPTTINAASFSVTCSAPCVSPAGNVTYDTRDRVAIFTPTSVLVAGTTYTATITTGATDLAANALGGNQASAPAAGNYVWTFTTGPTPDVTRPRVMVTAPVTTLPGPTTDTATNAAITATFTEKMNPSTLTAASFTVTCTEPCVSPAGTLHYSVDTNTVAFIPTVALTAFTSYTATITSAATDLAANALAGNQAALPAASNYVWTFTTAAALAPANISVVSTNPAAGAPAVCPNAAANATFNVPSGLRMDASTLNAATFTLTGPAPALTSVAAASVTLDSASGHIATFTPQSALVVGGTYTATISGGVAGVKDLAIPANDMTNPFTWSFTVAPATGNCLAPVALGAIAPFGTFGGTAGMTNTGILTVINGDIGTIATDTSAVTGFHDTSNDVYTESPDNIGFVNGTILTCTHSTTGPTSTGVNADSCTAATQARHDAQTAYLALAALPPGANPGGNLAGLTLAPGVYTAPSGSFMIQGGDLTLDAQGNSNAVWVFQMATTLTVGGPGAAFPRSVTLAGGAQAKNVFWQVGAAATINAGGGGRMVGTLLTQTGAVFSTLGSTTLVTLDGRAISLGASVTLVNTVINVPAP